MCILHAQPCHKLELAVYNLKAASSCACWFQPANMNHPNGVMWFIHPQISLNGLISQVTSCVVIFRGVDLRPRGVFFPQQQWIIDSSCWICWKSYSAVYPLLGTQTAMAMAAPTVHGYNLMVAMLKSRTKLGEVIGEKGTLYIFIEWTTLSLHLSLFFHTKDPEPMAISPRWSRRPAFSLVKGCCPTKLGCCVKESHWRMIFGFGSWRMALSSSLKTSQIGFLPIDTPPWKRDWMRAQREWSPPADPTSGG